jgi:hypothetical protein
MFFSEGLFESFLKQASDLQELTPISDAVLFDFLKKSRLRSQELEIVLQDLLMNAQEHGSSPIQFLHGRDKGVSSFLLCDHGAGIHQTVPENIRLSDLKGKSSSSIIRLFLEEGITGTGQDGRRMGLYYLSRLVSEKNAEALIASDSRVIIQRGTLFFQKSLDRDIGKNVILLQVRNSEVGL